MKYNDFCSLLCLGYGNWWNMKSRFVFDLSYGFATGLRRLFLTFAAKRIISEFIVMGKGCTCCSLSHGHFDNHDAHAHGDVSLLQAGLSCVLLLTGVGLDYFTDWENTIMLCRLPLYAVAYLLVGIPVIRQACHEMRKGEWATEFTLMVVATIGAIAIGELPEAVAVMLFYTVGEYFQGRAVAKTQNNVQALVGLHPVTVSVVRNGVSLCVAPEKVVPGEVIELPVGSRVPLDGKLLAPAVADFDLSALTGESVPRTAVEGEEVPGGALVLNAAVRLEVTKEYADSSLTRILAMIRDASERKVPAERFIRRVARIYTPAVILLAVLIALLPPLFGQLFSAEIVWKEWIHRSLVFLVVSCPCALVVSVPLAYFSGIGRAARKGILIKGGNVLDELARVNIAVFDKTGTLTKGEFSVSKMKVAEAADRLCLQGLSPLLLAASAESLSTHPAARALRKAAEHAGMTILSPESVKELPGKGVEAYVAGCRVLVGNDRLISVPFDMARYSVWCSVDDTVVAAFDFSDTLRPESVGALAALRRMGLHVGMLSGDKESIVSSVAGLLGISDWCGGLLPDGKVRELHRRLAEPGSRIAFVGDGINDAPSLALSNVGVAMGGCGSDVAVETADVVIQNDNVGRVADSFRLAYSVRRLVRLNIGLALGGKVAVLLLGALMYIPLWVAVLADTGMALLCVLNVMWSFVRNK